MLNHKKIPIKSPEDVKKMQEGGQKLAKIKKELAGMVAIGVRASDIEDKANELIEKEGGKASFKMVENYSWATCVNTNEGVVHGIPKKSIVFKKGDLVSIDVGIYYKGFHTDTSVSVGVDADENLNKFLDLGKRALKSAISKARVGNKVYDISEAIEGALKPAGVSPIEALVGHGVGRQLHEEPQIPCILRGNRRDSPEIAEGMTFAIEVMYAKGSPNLKLADDGWTISSSDGTITALFEDTIAVSKKGPVILTS